jgi:hypothetical protein
MLYSTQWFIVKKKKAISLRKLFDRAPGHRNSFPQRIDSRALQVRCSPQYRENAAKALELLAAGQTRRVSPDIPMKYETCLFCGTDSTGILRTEPLTPSLTRIDLYIKLSIRYIAYVLRVDSKRQSTHPGDVLRKPHRPRGSGNNKYVWKSSQQDAGLQKNPERDP